MSGEGTGTPAVPGTTPNRFHVDTPAIHPDKDLAIGHVLSFYTDENMGTLATLYAAETGVETCDNPYTVPPNGMVNFWT